MHNVPENPAPLVRRRLAELDKTRERLPLADPDRHALDTYVDAQFARLAYDHPEHCTANTNEQTGGAQ